MEFGNEVCTILNVIIILKKLQDYGDARFKKATENPEVLNIEENEKAFKAKNFLPEMIEKAKL